MSVANIFVAQNHPIAAQQITTNYRILLQEPGGKAQKQGVISGDAGVGVKKCAIGVTYVLDKLNRGGYTVSKRGKRGAVSGAAKQANHRKQGSNR
jgi:hypothetical protein